MTEGTVLSLLCTFQRNVQFQYPPPQEMKQKFWGKGTRGDIFQEGWGGFS